MDNPTKPACLVPLEFRFASDCETETDLFILEHSVHLLPASTRLLSAWSQFSDLLIWPRQPQSDAASYQGEIAVALRAQLFLSKMDTIQLPSPGVYLNRNNSPAIVIHWVHRSIPYCVSPWKPLKSPLKSLCVCRFKSLLPCSATSLDSERKYCLPLPSSLKSLYLLSPELQL